MILETIKEQKYKLRKFCHTTRQEIGEANRTEASRNICTQISHWSNFNNSQVILTYLPIKEEVDLRPLLFEFPQKKWILPRIIFETKEMFFHPYDSQKLVRHPFGMDEPAPNLPIIESIEIQLVLVPGLAFNRSGWRLGYGGGFYDRFLEDFSGVSLGITYDTLLLDNLPHDTFDLPVKWVITEKGILDLQLKISSENLIT